MRLSRPVQRRPDESRSTLEASLRSRNLREPRVIVETADIAITRGLLMESDLVTATSPHLFQHEIDVGALSVLPLARPGGRRGIGILQGSDSKPSIAVQLLMDGIRAVARS